MPAVASVSVARKRRRLKHSMRANADRQPGREAALPLPCDRRSLRSSARGPRARTYHLTLVVRMHIDPARADTWRAGIYGAVAGMCAMQLIQVFA